MKKIMISFLFAAIVTTGLQAQGSLRTVLNGIKSQETYSNVVYYGVDFSHVLINDAPKIPKSVEYSKVYPAAWIAFVEKELPPVGYVDHALGFPHFSYHQQEIYEKSIAVSPQFITDHDNDLSPDILKSMIDCYALEESSGLGLVLIPETFSKPRETAVTWVVFFDIGSHKILSKTKIFDKCSHMGYTAHWASGVVEGFKDFANR